MKSEQHDYLAKLKALADELGRMPQRDEFIRKYGISKRQIERLFGGFTPMVHSLGLGCKPAKIDKSKIFVRDINSVINSRPEIIKPNEELVPAEQLPILCIGDTHFPFVDVNALSALYAFAEKHRPRTIVQLGDLYDMFAWSKFPKSVNDYTPSQEIELGFKMASEMWQTLRKICPDSINYQLLGNHCVRPLKRVLELFPEGETFFSIDKFFAFDNVKTIMEQPSELILGDIRFIHGFASKLGQHRDHYLTNVVCGHSHHGGVSYRNLGDEIIYELNAGFLGDPNSKVFSYTPMRLKNWTLGFGWIDNFGPRFVCL